MPLTSHSLRERAVQGLWHNNQALVALLGLCPLLAVSNSLINGLALGLATTATLVLTSALIASLRNWILPSIRLPLFVLMIAVTVTVIDLLMQAYFHDLYQTLGLFIPLIVTNCAILGRAEIFAYKNPVAMAWLDGLFMGLGFTTVLVILGTVREILGTGAWLAHADWLFGSATQAWKQIVFDDEAGFLLALTPSGAFIGLGLLVALRNLIAFWLNRRESTS